MVEDQEQDQNYSYEEEKEETISLCDLPRDSFRWDDEYLSGSSKKYQSSSFDEEDYDDDNNFFEFFSEDFTATSTNYPNPKEIIFCGKLIPLVGKDQINHDQNQKPGEKIIRQEKPRSAKQSIFQYLKLKSNDNESLALALPTTTTTTTTTKNCSYGKKQKASFLGSSPAVKSRWYFFMFGMRAPSVEMGLSDMKNRQSRRRRGSHSATMFPSFEETTSENVSSKPRRKKSAKGFWELLRALGHRSRHAKVLAKATRGSSAIPKK